ncbi:phage virion morphogenesis protein [Capnocytophaga sp.]|uniref:phage virion morphogenesis protein n=1 Tax=Capnocytophaga sp. TaxID=44737 RepID=UPI0026DDB4A6|nr:phage virion morphogenesis protein [Capnocytophaga sp.]MDO5106128.1 phage virion morphogenesis protein [Capnocytophaga sp.]
MATFSGNMELIRQRLAQKLQELPVILGEEVVNFSLENFDKQAWQGETEKPWAKRKNPTKWGKRDEEKRAILVKTGAGRRSIRVVRTEQYKVFIGAGGEVAPYMRLHNYGFQGNVNQNVRPFQRKLKNGKVSNVSGFSRTINQNIPKRQFIGGENEAPRLKERLQKVVREELNQIFK